MKTTSRENKLVRVTAWVPQKTLKMLMKKNKSTMSQSELLRNLIDHEAERLTSLKAHQALYGSVKAQDIDDRLL